ncbi:uncharacterized protein E0L32_009193 [Thyridium curvatum]|uniref:NYN domain-containing protein n=1 Tax=Thyridium curvatum TaxID=1093900 RepID=A0A507AJJ0_9PEZI|nr:uncharacterized protein E0L32_009193 [Thyridium curvatum]TPX09592.1 hypothetical protein E0L32_009193 [Thyridium curvatum]
MGDSSGVQMPSSIPSSPASPKLGNFSRIFQYLTLSSPPPPVPPHVTEGDGVSQKAQTQPLSSPSPRASTPRAYASGFLGGLDLTSVLPDSQAADARVHVSSDEETEGVDQALASSLPETSSTAASSPPSDSNDFVTKHVQSRANVTPYLARSAHNSFLYQQGLVASSIALLEATRPAGALRTRNNQASASPAWTQPYVIVPKYTCSKEDKLRLLQAKLAPQYDLDALGASTYDAAGSQSVHIFVDLSNIVIGFYNSLKICNGIPVDQYVKVPPFFFEGFATVLERGRSVGGRKLAGSVVDNTDRSRWPDYMYEAEAAGYEMNILNRVDKMTLTPKPASRKGYRSGGGREYPSDAYSSDDAAPLRQKRSGEQGVDELLHMKMCQCVLDFSPGTMVLATGDAAAAEFSDGFLVNVQRALKNGWRVELVSWRTGIASAWRNLERRREWAGRFRIIELDSLVDELVGSHLAQ